MAAHEVWIHQGEVASDAEDIATYAEAIAFVVAVVAILAAAWLAAAPSEAADLPTRAGDAATVPAPAVREERIVSGAELVDPELGSAATHALEPPADPFTVRLA